jgi:hypothetical protein
MAVFYLAISGLIGMSYVFYLNSGSIPQSMVSLKVHAHFAGLGWLALTTMGLAYKLLPLELGTESVPQRWGGAASVLINGVFWGVFLSYAYDWSALRVVSAVLACASVICHSLQVRTIARVAKISARLQGVVYAESGRPDLARASWDREAGASPERPGSLPYTQASCIFGVAATLLAMVLTSGLVGGSFAVEYAYAYAAAAGWFGLFLTGQIIWLLPLLYDDAGGNVSRQTWRPLEFPGQVIGTLLVTTGFVLELAVIVVLGATVNLLAALMVTARSLRLWWAQPATVGR